MANRKLKLGILLPTRWLVMTRQKPSGFEIIISMAERAEEAGLDSVWVGDSLTSTPRLEPLATLAAVASRTRRVRLGTSILLAALRHPVLLAQTIGTVDLISQGRTVLAVATGGALRGAQRSEWQAAGVDPATRAGRLEELLEITKRLTAGDEVTFRGRHFHLESVRVEPGHSQPGGVPILLGCHWQAGQERQFQRAARLADGFISASDPPDQYAQTADRVRHYARQEGKDFDTMEAAVYLTVNIQRNEEKAAEEADRFLMMCYGTNFWGDMWGPFGPPARIVERIKEYAQAGAGTIIVRFASFDPQGQLETFIREVAPAL